MSAPLVVVGAGSAGAVIAARVSERGQRGVVLVEAGVDYAPQSLPFDLADASRNSMISHDWGYRHRPTSTPVRLLFPRGKVVGGSSAVNTCIALRGPPSDYDEWAERGLVDWSWERCLPAFRRLERDLDFADAWHGSEGPLPIRRHRPEELALWQAGFLEACRELGLPSCPDSNRPGSHGAGPHAMNKLDGRRISVAEAYLTPEVRARLGFSLLTGALVRRVLFENRRAVGIELEREGQVERLAASEVVLCAGAINTPGILLRSGLGPRAQIERLGVELVVDLPGVGARLLDHPGSAMFLRPKRGSGTDRKAPLIQTALRYPSAGSSHACDILLQPGSKLNTARFDFPLVSLMCAIGKPHGTGQLQFTSARPRAKPVIRSLLLEDASDRRKAVDVMALAFELSQSKALSDIATPFWPSERTLRDKRRIDAWIRYGTDSGYHPCGTAPMGLDSDPAAVTDGRGRVRGVHGLRIADASLFPSIPSANTNLTVIMLGERFGEWLAADTTR